MQWTWKLVSSRWYIIYKSTNVCINPWLQEHQPPLLALCEWTSIHLPLQYYANNLNLLPQVIFACWRSARQPLASIYFIPQVLDGIWIKRLWWPLQHEKIFPSQPSLHKNIYVLWIIIMMEDHSCFIKILSPNGIHQLRIQNVKINLWIHDAINVTLVQLMHLHTYHHHV